MELGDLPACISINIKFVGLGLDDGDDIAYVGARVDFVRCDGRSFAIVDPVCAGSGRHGLTVDRPGGSCRLSLGPKRSGHCIAAAAHRFRFTGRVTVCSEIASRRAIVVVLSGSAAILGRSVAAVREAR
jgi:hypothetical protein